MTPQTAGLVAFATAGKAEANLDKESDTTLYWRQFKPAKGRAAVEAGHCRDKVIFGRYDYHWEGKSFIVYSTKYVDNYAVVKNYFILAKRDEVEIVSGQTKTVDELIKAASQYANDLHEEVYVFDQEEWTKSSDLWESVQQSTWDDVCLSPVYCSSSACR